MKNWKKTLICIVLFFGFLMTSVGYAAITDNLSILGSVDVEGEFYDDYISKITPESLDGVTITNCFGTTMSAEITADGQPTF